MNSNNPYAYFITFTCYGARLHGDARGTVDRHHNIIETPCITQNIKRSSLAKARMKGKNYLLDAPRRDIVLKEVKRTCTYNNWLLIAAHIRSNHVHIVLRAMEPPEFILKQLKSYISRSLNKHFPEDKTRKKWTKHGSTRYIWAPLLVEAAIEYVLQRQGKPMSIYSNSDYMKNMIDDLDSLLI